MKLHRNAKTTPLIRALLARRVREEGWPVARVAEALGVSRQTVYRWAGRTDYTDRSSVPTRQPRRTPAAKVAAIVAARHTGLTAWRIGVQLQIPRSTVAVVLARYGLQRLQRLGPAAPVVRYERQRVGELVHL